MRNDNAISGVQGVVSVEDQFARKHGPRARNEDEFIQYLLENLMGSRPSPTLMPPPTPKYQDPMLDEEEDPGAIDDAIAKAMQGPR